MIRFLFGRPGCGKTHRILEAVRDHIRQEQRAYLIVPDQEVYSCERDLLSALPSDAGRFFEIMSFSRLCDQIFGRYGGRALYTMTQGTRSLLMWQNLRELKGLLTEYRTEADAALTAMMLSAVDELSVNSVTSPQLERAAKALPKDHPLSKKLNDIALIMATYNHHVSELCGDNPADLLLRAHGVLEQHPFFENTFVYIDSFTSFTAQEYVFLKDVFRQAAGVTVALGSDGRNSREIQFSSICDTADRLSDLAEDLGKPYQDELLTTPYRQHVTELQILEQDLWNLQRSKEERRIPAENDRGHVRLICADTVYDEAEAAALHVLEAVEHGVPFGEIALVVRDVSQWSGILDAALEQYGIPYFVSTRTDLNTRPAARLLPCALRCIARGWQAHDVMSLLKTGLCGVSNTDADLFEDYVHTWNLRGSRMLDELWSMNPDGYQTSLSERGKAILAAANRVRSTVIPPLQTLQISLKTASTVTDQCRALYAYLDTLSIRDQLAKQAEQELLLEHPREAGENARLWPFLCEALASIATSLPEDSLLSCSELETALSILFASTDMGSVPLRHDCVTVGSASLLRVSHVRVAIVLGLCEGEFPRAVSDQGVFSEKDKQFLSDQGIKLGSRSDKQSADEMLYVYRTVTTPSDDLILSYSRQTLDGRQQSASAAVKRVQFLLPYLQEEPFYSSMVTDADVSCERLPSLAYDSLPSTVIRSVFGNRLKLSQDKLQTFFKCPFSYYAKHLLKLREPVTAAITNVETGIFLHHVLETFLSTTLDEQNRIRPLKDGEFEALADRIIRDYLNEVCHANASASGRFLHIFSRMRTVALALLHSIVDELTASAFTPFQMEWNTNAPDGSGPSPMILQLDENTDPAEAVELILGGVVDRVDLYRKDDRIYIRVVDYKSSYHDFSEQDMIKSLNIQLMLYLFTLCSPQNKALFAGGASHAPVSVVPASAVYMSPDENKSNGQISAVRTGVILEDEAVLTAVSPDGPDFLPGVSVSKAGKVSIKGLYSEARMSELENTLKSLIRATAADMYSGCANRTPSSTACQYCRMRSGCYLAVQSTF